MPQTILTWICRLFGRHRLVEIYEDEEGRLCECRTCGARSEEHYDFDF
jgi:hypothetical protein